MRSCVHWKVKTTARLTTCSLLPCKSSSLAETAPSLAHCRLVPAHMRASARHQPKRGGRRPCSDLPIPPDLRGSLSEYPHLALMAFRSVPSFVNSSAQKPHLSRS